MKEKAREDAGPISGLGTTGASLRSPISSRIDHSYRQAGAANA